ncbi:MAG: hypothetical protein HC810_07290 [Acaryochloridaceae cyanobacterium RL_2_7]|nr:hypothetical protein [Acaryochloridaceae cyanobacterium RL_2_7]
MRNSFFQDSLDKNYIKGRIKALAQGKIGLYSIGLYPASIAYNCAMQKGSIQLMLAPRPGRELLGAFSPAVIAGMDQQHVQSLEAMALHQEAGKTVPNNLEWLIQTCDLVILSGNSNYIEQDLMEAREIRDRLQREEVVLGCLAGSYSHDHIQNDSYVLCEKEPNLAFFSGFHRHDALRDPIDSFTGNFCHPNALTALFGAYLMDNISLNIQVSPGVHNIEAQYIKAAKNMASIFAGFSFEYHQENSGVLPTVLTLLLGQCLDQAATVSMSRRNRAQLYDQQTLHLTELGYGVQGIEATLDNGGDMETIRDHTFSQLTAMVADVRGSMMLPVHGKPTRNFQAGQILARMMRREKRCPKRIEEFEAACEAVGLKKGGLEGLKALRYWPQIRRKYKIPVNDSSLVNLLYLAFYGTPQDKEFTYTVMTKSRQLSNYCQESVRPTHSRRYSSAINTLDQDSSVNLLTAAIIADIAKDVMANESDIDIPEFQESDPAYLQTMLTIEQTWN